MTNYTEQPLTLTVEQAAKLLGIGRSTAYELVHTGDIPSLRLGRRIVVPKARLAEMLSDSDGGEPPTESHDEPRTDGRRPIAPAFATPTLFDAI